MNENDRERQAIPHPPYEDLRAAAGSDADARARVDALHAEMHAPEPNPAAVEEHASRLRGVSVLEARIANWWDDPNTQRWVKAISDANL